MARYLTPKDDLNALVKRKCYLVLDFTADWCGPCKKIAPVFEELAEKHGRESQLEFLKVDNDAFSEITAEFGVVALPTFQVFWRGQCIYSTEGGNEENLRTLVDRVTERMAVGEDHLRARKDTSSTKRVTRSSSARQ